MNMPTPRRSSSNRVTGGAAGGAGAWAETFRDNTAPAKAAVEENTNCRRFMESSRRRNSILDWLIAATLAFAAISGTAGIDVALGPVALRSHSAIRVMAVAIILIAIRWRLRIDSFPLWLT